LANVPVLSTSYQRVENLIYLTLTKLGLHMYEYTGAVNY